MNGPRPDAVKILYVEDDETIRMVGSAALRDAGFDVLEAKSADEAMLLLSDPDHVGALLAMFHFPYLATRYMLMPETRHERHRWRFRTGLERVGDVGI